jgi:DNA polymerase (family 10)
VACSDSVEDRDAALDVFSKLGQFIQRGENRASIRFTNNGRTMQVDLWIVPSESWGSALNYATGSKNHNVHLRMLAGQNGMTVNEYGIFRLCGDVAGDKLGGADEHDLYRLLGIPYVEPQDRT